MAQTLVVLRTGETELRDIPASSTSAAVARGADATHVDSAAVTTHVDNAPVLPAAAQMSGSTPSASAAEAVPAATIAPVSSAMQGSAAPVVMSDSHSDSGSDGIVGRSASFELPFTHEVASGSDVVYVTQDDGSIVVADSDVGLITDWTIIV